MTTSGRTVHPGYALLVALSACHRTDLEWETDNPAYFDPPEPWELWEDYPTSEFVWRQYGWYDVVACAASDEQRVYAQSGHARSDYFMTAFELATGEVVWTSTEYGFHAMATDAVPDVVLYGKQALDRATGERRWSLYGDTSIDIDWPSVRDGTLYASAALDVATGEVLWQREEMIPRARVEVDDRAVYFHNSDHRFYALDRQTGETLWSIPSDFPWVPARSDGERVYLQIDEDSQLAALDAATGELIWETQRPDLGSPHWMDGWSRPTVADGKVYAFRYDEERMFALDAETGEILWATLFYGATGNGRLEPTVHEGEVYIYGVNTFLRVVDAETGEPRWWSDQIGSPESGCAPRIHGDYVVLTDGGSVIVLRRP